MKQKRIVIFLIWTFIIVVAWIGMHLYHNHTTSTITESEQVDIKPIDPNFDMETIQRLKDRLRVTPVYQLDGSVTTRNASPAATPSPVVTSAPVASPTASVRPSP